ncbi:MAG: leucyl/phenylalanyl-tRNA--protein transferase [Cytophagales bacterium]|nr:leucyl/phenylalanyl-tRNA--protein transferase [Cytophagales bacterium]
MPIFRLNNELIFPNPEFASKEGILAIGGDLSIERLLLAYKNGIFPWYSEGEPIIWWSPDPRFVLYPEKLKISRSMKQVLKKDLFRITLNQNFYEVISNCKKIARPRQGGTWLTDAMLEAYVNLHKAGYAHSVEVWKDGNLVGGLYGVSLGKCFFGESMFSKMSNASKAGFITLVNELKKSGFRLIDCQVYTDHLKNLGAEEIPRTRFMTELEGNHD